MAEVSQRIWRSGPRKVKRTAWGYTYQQAGKQVRKFNAAWSKQDAERELAGVEARASADGATGGRDARRDGRGVPRHPARQGQEDDPQ